jgi:hypothetical protein
MKRSTINERVRYEIIQDQEVDNPLDNEEAVSFFWYDSRRAYNNKASKHRFISIEDTQQYLHGDYFTPFNGVFVYINYDSHSGISIVADEEQANGYAFIDDCKESTEDAIKWIESVIHEFNMYVLGEVYGYNIYVDDEDVDSCWGYYGWEYCEEAAKEQMNYYLEKLKDDEADAAIRVKYIPPTIDQVAWVIDRLVSAEGKLGDRFWELFDFGVDARAKLLNAGIYELLSKGSTDNE